MFDDPHSLPFTDTGDDAIALDTSRYTDLCRGKSSVVETVELADEVWPPFIMLGEFRAGFAVGSKGPHNEAVLQRFLLNPGVAILYADEQTTHHHAAVYRRKQGTSLLLQFTRL